MQIIYAVDPLCLQGLHLQIQPTVDENTYIYICIYIYIYIYIYTFRVFRKLSLNLLHNGNYLHSIYVALCNITNLEVIKIYENVSKLYENTM